MPARFVCFTPYHLLLADTIAEQIGLADAEVVFGDESKLGDSVDEVLVGRPLRVVERLHPIGDSRGWERYSLYTRNRRRLSAWARSQQPDALYLFNPLRPESRAVAERLTKTLHFVEDGIEAYVQGAQPTRRVRWLRRAASFTMGVAPFLERDFVAYGGWHEAWALLPHRLIVPSGQTVPPVRSIDHSTLASVVERWSRRVGMPEAVGACDVLVMLDHPDSASGLSITRAMRLTTAWGIDPERVLVKPHPRDARPMQVIIDEYSAAAVEGRWPVELTISALRPNAIVMGGNSTGMLSAAVLRPDIELHLRAREGSPLRTLIRSLGVRVHSEPLEHV